MKTDLTKGVGYEKYLKRKIHRLEVANNRVRCINLLLTVAVGILLLILSKQTIQIQLQKNEIKSLNADVINYTATISDLEEKNSEVVDIMSRLAVTANTINEELNTLKEQYNTAAARLKELEEREELYDKYDYALFYEGERTDVTYQRIKNVKEYCKDEGLSDDAVGFVMSLVATESHGDASAENENSTAAGLGQLLYDTAKYIYEEEMGNGEGTYKYDLALNPDTNLEMVTAYVSYLTENYGDNPIKVLNAYRGESSPGYINSIEVKLKQSDLSLYTMNLKND